GYFQFSFSFRLRRRRERTRATWSSTIRDEAEQTGMSWKSWYSTSCPDHQSCDR
ncbi:hypothetical protein L9F63_007436, partial [Diploptera punctata]